MAQVDQIVQSDVIVLGGGHVGLYTAEQLASKGFRVSLIEKKKAIGERVVCTGIIGNEAFEKYDLPTETIIGKIQHIRFHSPFGNSFEYDPPKPLAEIVDRSRFNRHFEDQALRAGVQIFTGHAVDKVKIKNEFACVKSYDQNQTAFLFEAPLLILATGVNTQFFHSVGIRPPTQFLSGAQVQIPYQGEMRTSIYTGTSMAPGAFGWMVPLGSGVAKVGLMAEKSPMTYIRRLLDQVMPGWRDDIPESQIDLRPILQGPLDRSYANRVMVVGEAAGQIKTTTGGGIYYGMLGADIAVEVASNAFKKNRFKADILSSYDKRWKKVIAEELRVGYYFRKVYAKLSDEQVESLFDKVIQKEVLALAYEKAEFDWHKGLMGSVIKLPAFRRMFQNPF